MDQIAGEKTKPRSRIQSLECFRLIASMLVVFIHCEGSGEFGSIMNCLARVAVPFFFIVSGYFLYEAKEKTVRKRFWSVLKLNVIAHLLYVLWNGYQNGIEDLGDLAEWVLAQCSSYTLTVLLLLSRSPIGIHLWYLNAMVFSYAVIWLYIRWAEGEKCSYKPLYTLGVCLCAIHIVLGSFGTVCGFEIPSRLYRNALLFGFPMFTLGIFLRENGSKILRVYNLMKLKLIFLMFVGACLSIIQWRGAGEVEMPVGTLLEVIALMLLLVSVPEVSDSIWLSRIISTFGALSTYVYITHLIWADVYLKYFKRYALSLGESAEAFLYPFFVIGITLATGIAYLCVRFVLNWVYGKIRAVCRKSC